MMAPTKDITAEKTKYSYGQVRPVADQIVSSLKPFCEKIEVAGSLRREKAMIGDIEIVAIPKRIVQPGLMDDVSKSENELHRHLDYLVDQQKIAKHKDARNRPSWGKKLRKFVVTTSKGHRFKVDLFMCEEENWGNTMLIRTGSKDFSRWMVTRQDVRYNDLHHGAMPDDMRHRDGRLWEYTEDDEDYDWRALPIKTEWDFFDAIHLPYIPPTVRQGDQWFAWLKEYEDFLEEAGGHVYWTDKI
jgi:DNA polymerase/3'-5' exonuclease PolX